MRQEELREGQKAVPSSLELPVMTSDVMTSDVMAEIDLEFARYQKMRDDLRKQTRERRRSSLLEQLN